jgi:hypothetical protein
MIAPASECCQANSLRSDLEVSMLTIPMNTKDNKGFFIRPPRELINRLEKASREFKKNSANQVAVEVLDEYLDAWIKIETIRRQARDEQQRGFEAMRQRLHEATTAPATKPLAKRKTR